MDDVRAMVLLPPGLQSLIDLLRDRGWTVIGPTVRDGVVELTEVESVEQFPRGVGDLQDAGSYRLRDRDDEALFGYVVGPQGWTSLLFPSCEMVGSGRREGPEMDLEAAAMDAPRLALLGVRSCDLPAMRFQDGILARRSVTDPAYVARRENTFIIALTCSDPAGNCFCASMGTGPVPDQGFDLTLTELLDDGWHRFLVVAGSDRGEDLLDELKAGAVGDEILNAARADFDAAHEVGMSAARRMGRSLDTDGLPDPL